MNGYTKLFSQIVTSTIWQEPNDCRVLWITMLALKDDKSLCPATVPYLAKACNLSIEQTETYLEQFQNPDPYSRSQEFEGRRIRKVDGGWLILNGQKYRDALRSFERKDYIREKVREHRVNKRKQGKQGKPISDTDTKADSDPNPLKIERESIPPDPEDLKKYFIENGSDINEAQACYAFYKSKGWIVGKTPMKSWRGSAAGWILRERKKGSQQ